ncbi:MAG: hypothetical protein JWO11_3061 [Nocardioides sp.]|jgi:hypothetical protein|nr:hypothetical protein [Nocardioides sp.]
MAVKDSAPVRKVGERLDLLRTRKRTRDLSARVAELEDQVRECRLHHHRTAELVDVVTALLVPIARGDQEEVDRVLRDYTDGLG